MDLVEKVARRCLACDLLENAEAYSGYTDEWAGHFWSLYHLQMHMGDCGKAESKWQAPITCNRCVCDDAERLAKAIIPIVLEEAAKVADKRWVFWRDGEGGGCRLSLLEECEDIAAAIRALGEK